MQLRGLLSNSESEEEFPNNQDFIIDTEALIKDGFSNTPPPPDIDWEKLSYNPDNLTSKPQSLFYHKIDKCMPILEKGKAKISDRRSFEMKYWAITFFACFALIALPFFIWLITYILLGKPRNAIHSSLKNHRDKISSEIDSICANYPTDLDADECKWIFKEYDYFDETYELVFPKDIWPKANYLAKKYRELDRLLKETGNPGHGEILPAVLSGIGVLVLLWCMLPEFMKLFRGNGTYFNSIAQRNKINNDTLDANENETLTDIVKLLNIPDSITIESLANILKEIQDSYKERLFPFWLATREAQLPTADVHRVIYAKMDSLILAEESEKRLNMQLS